MANTLNKSRANQRPQDGMPQKIQTKASYSKASGMKASCGGASSSNAVNRPSLKGALR